MRRPQALGDLQRCGADAAGAAVDEDGLAGLQPAAQLEREVGGVVVEDQAGPLLEADRVGQLEGEIGRGDGTTSANPPSMQNAATRSPGLTGASSGALRTTPPTSLPGTNGSGGLNWYSRASAAAPGTTPRLRGHRQHAAARGEQVVGLGLGDVGQGQRSWPARSAR